MASAHAMQEWQALLLFALGAIVMRGAGCVVNDIIDRNIDAQVERTKSRPIASGAVSVKQAIAFLTLLLTIGLIILLQFNTTTRLLGIIILLPIIIYPFMKRFTYWPQLFLGLTFNWGALMGWAAVSGHVSVPAVLIYLAGIFWTLGYDTIYAHQDKEDDLAIGVKSTALAFGSRSKKYVTLFYLLTLLFLILAGIFRGYGFPFFSAIAVTALHFAWQIRSVNLDDPTDCLIVFRSNAHMGWIPFLGIFFEKLL